MSIPTKGLIFHGAGTTATSILSGNVDPTTEGGPGDFYVRLDTGELFGPKDPSTGWPSTSIDLTGIADGSVTTIKIADDAVTQAKIADNAVGSDQIAADAVGSSEIASGAVGSSELASGVSSQLIPSGGSAGQVLQTNGSGSYLFVTLGTSDISGLSTALSGKADLVDGKLKSDQIPAIALTDVYTAASEAAQLALTGLEEGDVVIRSDINKSFIHNGGTTGLMTDFLELKTPTDAVLSVNGETGAVTLDHTDVGAAAASHTHTLADITDFDGTDYAAASHTHTLADITDAGTAAGKNAPASGNASSTEVVLGSDTRLTNERTPTDGSVSTAKIADSAVTTAKINDSAVTSAKINDGAVSSGKLASAVSSQLIPSGGTTGQALTKGASGYEWSTVSSSIARQSLEQSVTVAAGAEVSIDLSLAKSFAITKIVASKPCRFRLYNTAASRTADTSRLSTSAPAADSGLIMEAIFTSDLLSLPVFPAQIGQNQESTPSSTMKALVRNDAASADLTLTISYLPLEA